MELPSTHLLQTLIRGAGSALGVQVASLGVIYGTQILLARWMGVAEYGLYEYVGTISQILGFIAGLGLSNVALRFVAEYQVKQDWPRLRGVIWGSWWQTAVTGIGVAAIGSLILWGLNQRSPIQHLTTLILGLWSVPLLALTKLQLEMVRAVRRIALAYAPSLVVYPLLLLSGIVIWRQVHPDFAADFTSSDAIGISLIVLSIVLVVQLWLFQKALPVTVWQVQPQYAMRQWFGVALPLLFVDGSFMLLNQTDTLMINAFLNPTAVGIYTAAFKTASWVSFILVAVNAIAAPLFASLYAEGNPAELQRLVSTIARWMFYPALIMAIGLVIAAEPILRLFGPEFTAARWSMVALIIGQLVNVGAGSVGYLLNMTGHHRQCARVVGYSALVNVGLNAIGIPLFGIAGAAIATALSMSLWNIWLNRLVVQYLGVNPSILAALRQPRTD